MTNRVNLSSLYLNFPLVLSLKKENKATICVDLKIKEQFLQKKSFIIAIGIELDKFDCQITIADENKVFTMKSELISNINFIVPSQFAFMLWLTNGLDRENHTFTLCV